jgi:hypothetical protein
MWELVYEPSADATMTALERDPSGGLLLERVYAAIRALAANPGDERCRRHAYPGGIWGLAVRTRTDDWIVLWRYGPGEHQLTVLYAGPQP